MSGGSGGGWDEGIGVDVSNKSRENDVENSGRGGDNVWNHIFHNAFPHEKTRLVFDL